MKHLLFLSFLINISCLDALKSSPDDEEDEEDEEDDERREGTRQGDCTDGEDNDDDGDIDCDDSGCSDKPACEGDTGSSIDTSDDPDFEQVDFSGQISSSFVFESSMQEEGYENCNYVETFTPASGDVTEADSCSGCTLFGQVDVVAETDCSFYQEGSYTIDLALSEPDEVFYFYSANDGQWMQLFTSDGCNNRFDTNLSSLLIQYRMYLRRRRLLHSHFISKYKLVAQTKIKEGLLSSWLNISLSSLEAVVLLFLMKNYLFVLFQ